MARWAFPRPPGRLLRVAIATRTDRDVQYCLKYCTRSGQTTSVQAMDRDEIAARIPRAGRRRTRAMEAKRDASAELAELIPLARKAGIGVTEIVRLSGMSPRGVYDMVERQS
jgi:hypothetical protein